jgi:hypothetical protein
MDALGRGRVKTSARFRTSLFRSLLRGLRAFRVEKIAKNLALLDRLQNLAEFLHGLGRFAPFATPPVYDRYLRFPAIDRDRLQAGTPLLHFCLQGCMGDESSCIEGFI